MKGKKMKLLGLVLILSLVASLMLGCAKTESKADTVPQPEVQENQKSLIMATTTSTQDSGLLDYLLPKFTEETGIEVKVVAVGTGQALKMGEDGEADVLLVHAKSSEEEFVKAGHGLERFDVMYNDFVLVGPKEDPLKIKETAGKDIAATLKIIAEKKGTFISRGDDSGTHKAELKLWKATEIEPAGEWYLSAGQGMGKTIQMANEKLGYTLSDRASFLSMQDKLDLEIVVEGDDKLFNQYGVIAVNPNKNDKMNHEGAQKFVDWILTEEAQGLIGEFGKDTYGQSLFVPNAKK